MAFTFSKSEAARRNQFMPAVKSAAAKYGVPVAMLDTIFHRESSYNPKAWNPGDAAHGNGTLGGLGQMMVDTGKSHGLTKANAHDPIAQINASAHLARSLLDRSGKEGIRGAFRRYNGKGPMAERYANESMKLYSQIAGVPAGQYTGGGYVAQPQAQAQAQVQVQAQPQAKTQVTAGGAIIPADNQEPTPEINNLSSGVASPVAAAPATVAPVAYRQQDVAPIQVDAQLADPRLANPVSVSSVELGSQLIQQANDGNAKLIARLG